LNFNAAKKIFFLVLLFIVNSYTIVIAQTTKIHLLIKGERNEPYQNATATLQNQNNGHPFTPIKKVVNSIDSFEVLKNTRYLLIVSATNKKSDTTDIFIKDSSVFVSIVLKEKINQLSGITVVSKKALMKEEDDKTIVDAASLTVSSTNAFEVIEKTPGAIIDQDGNIYLTSTNPATVFINGREMKLNNLDLSALLKSLPANSVNKIEILRNPSAKYDAASSGGIINIVLKKGVKLGSNGSINLSYFQGVYATKSGGFTFNKSSEKWNSYFSYQFTDKTSFEQLKSDRSFSSDSISVNQRSFTKYNNTTHYANGGVNYEVNDQWSVALDSRVTYSKNDNIADNKIDMILHPSELEKGKSNAYFNNKNHFLFASNTLSSKCKIDTTGSEWTNVFDLSNFNYYNNQVYSNNNSLPVKPLITGDGINENKKIIVNLQSDLTLKLPHSYTLEMGIKIGNSTSKNAANYFKDTGNHIRYTDVFQTNQYDYKEKIGAAYIQFSKSFFGFTLKPGLRFENTFISGNQTIPSDTTFLIKRNDLFPYLFLKHKLFKMYGQTLMASLIFRKSIKRPFYESLNPYPKLIDQYLYEVGNPSLKPQFTTNYECNVTFNDIPVLAVGYNETKDIFSSVIYQDNNSKIAYRTYDNLGKNKEIYGRLITGIPPGGKYFLYRRFI
jgi:hypothetical protein